MHCGIIHYATDVVFLRSGETEVRIPYVDLERNLPQQLIVWKNRHALDTIIAINGPGSFTSLRIGSLALQTLKHFSQEPVTIFSLSKIELYTLCIESGFLPRHGVIGIGQRKKMRLYEWSDTPGVKTMLTEAILASELNNTDYFIDFIGAHVLLESLKPERMVQMKPDETGLLMIYKGKEMIVEYSMLQQSKPVEQVVPNYMIEPTLS